MRRWLAAADRGPVVVIGVLFGHDQDQVVLAVAGIVSGVLHGLRAVVAGIEGDVIRPAVVAVINTRIVVAAAFTLASMRTFAASAMLFDVFAVGPRAPRMTFGLRAEGGAVSQTSIHTLRVRGIRPTEKVLIWLLALLGSRS